METVTVIYEHMWSDKTERKQFETVQEASEFANELNDCYAWSVVNVFGDIVEESSKRKGGD